MNCDEFEARIHRQLDRRVPLDSDARLSQHADDCSECAAKLGAYAQLFEGLEWVQTPSLDDRFAPRVVQLACSQPAPGSALRRASLTRGSVRPTGKVATAERRLWRRAFSPLAAGAIAILLLLATLPLLRDRGVSISRALSEPGGIGNTTGAAQPAEVTVTEEREEAPYDATELRLWWESLTLQVVAEPVEPLEVFQGLRPVATSLDSVFSELLDTWPWGRQLPPETSHDDDQTPRV